MTTIPVEKLEQILVIGAHADDIEIGCGGTLLRLLEEQSLHVHWVVLCAPGERSSEAQTAAQRVLQNAKSHEIEIADFIDSRFPANYSELKDYFVNLGQRTAPDLIFSHRREDLHQDHRLAAELTWNTFRQHLILEYEIPKYEGDLGQPNVYVSLTEKQTEEKVAVIMDSFESQQGKSWFDESAFTSLLRLRGIETGGPGRFAEGFYCRKMVL